MQAMLSSGNTSLGSYLGAGLCAFALAALAFGYPAYGADDTPGSPDALWSLLATQTQAQGRFEQKIYAADGELMEESSGRYAVLKPNFFRWEIEYPDRQQIVVAGDVLWHYDLDLETATKRAHGEEGAFTPLELLAGDATTLRERFEVEGLDSGTYRLVPLFPQAGFASVDIQWAGTEIVAMTIRDRSAQLIRLALAPDASGAPLTPGDFSFTPPAGVEVYDALEP